MIGAVTASLLLVTLVPSERAESDQDALWAELRRNPTNVVDFFASDRESESPARARSSGASSSTTTSSASGRGGSSASACIPRVRVLDGVPQRGSACPDGSGSEGEAGGLVWVPAGEGADDPAVEPVVVTREDVESLLVGSGSLEVQPDQAWVLVNAETIVFTDAAEHVLTTQLLGLDVELRVVPAQHTWDFGDGSNPLVGSDPGAPWPNHTVAHTYSTVGEARITLHTEWDAHFRAEGTSAWVPVTGRPVTIATSDPFQVVAAVPRLTG